MRPDEPLTIRSARVADAPVLARAEREIAATPGLLASRPHELLDERFAAKIEQLTESGLGCYLVAERGGEVVGHGFLDPLLVLEVVHHIVHLTLAVHPGWQRHGIGQALMSELIAWAREAPSVEKLELHVRSSNEPAIALYRKLGFQEEGRLRGRIKLAPGAYLDDVIMALWVKPVPELP